MRNFRRWSAMQQDLLKEQKEVEIQKKDSFQNAGLIVSFYLAFLALYAYQINNSNDDVSEALVFKLLLPSLVALPMAASWYLYDGMEKLGEQMSIENKLLNIENNSNLFFHHSAPRFEDDSIPENNSHPQVFDENRRYI